MLYFIRATLVLVSLHSNRTLTKIGVYAHTYSGTHVCHDVPVEVRGQTAHSLYHVCPKDQTLLFRIAASAYTNWDFSPSTVLWIKTHTPRVLSKNTFKTPVVSWSTEQVPGQAPKLHRKPWLKKQKNKTTNTTSESLFLLECRHCFDPINLQLFQHQNHY